MPDNPKLPVNRESSDDFSGYLSHPAPDWQFPDLIRAIHNCVQGDPGARLHQAIAQSMRIPNVLITNLGRTALYLGLKALRLPEGSKVLVPNVVCPTVIRAVLRASLHPILVDVGKNMLVTPDTISEEDFSHARAIIVPHLYGLTAPILQIIRWAERRGDFFVIDDAAQAAGMSLNGQCLGTFGTFGILSFGPFKSLNCPRGGALLSHHSDIVALSKSAIPNSESYPDAIRRIIAGTIKFHFRTQYIKAITLIRRIRQGSSRTAAMIPNSPYYEDHLSTVNSMEAAIVFSCFERIQAIIHNRSIAAQRIHEILGPFKQIQFVGPRDAPYLKLPLRIRAPMKADAAVAFLRRMKIEAERIYRPLHMYADFFAYAKGSYPNSEDSWDHVFLIPNPVKPSDALLHRIHKAFSLIFY